MKFLNWTICVVAALALSVAVSERAIAQDKVSVGVFPVSSSLPYFVALERGFFKEANIEPEMTKLMGGPPNVAAPYDPDEWMRRLGTLPLMHHPGKKWMYNTGSYVLGVLIARAAGQPLEAFFRERIFAPLGMTDSGFVTTAEQRARQARLHQRQADGSLLLQPLEPPATAAEFWSGGGPLYSTARDYLQLLQMLLHGGAWNGARLLRPETVVLMGENQTGAIPAGVMKTALPEMSSDVDFFPGARIRWGLGYMLNLDPGPNGRSAGTVSWGGLFNTYYWLDPVRHITGLIMTQILPFADPRVVALYGRFERAIYEALPAA